MSALYGYFDESGKSHDHDVVVFSGFVTTWDAWEDLSDEWTRLLRQFNLPVLHFKDQKRRAALLKKFISATKRHVEFGISAAVKVDAFNNLPDHVKLGLGNDPHYLAFKVVVFSIVQKMIREPGSVINFVCDEDEETTLPCYRWYKLAKRQFKDMREQLVSFAVADDKHFPQLQASDLMAALMRYRAERVLLGKEDAVMADLYEHLARLEDDRRLTFMFSHLEENHLRQLAENFENVGDVMEEFSADI